MLFNNIFQLLMLLEKLRNDLQMKKEEDKRKKEENAEIEKVKSGRER